MYIDTECVSERRTVRGDGMRLAWDRIQKFPGPTKKLHPTSKQLTGYLTRSRNLAWQSVTYVPSLPRQSPPEQRAKDTKEAQQITSNKMTDKKKDRK